MRTDGRPAEREGERDEIGEREATGFQNICDVSVHQSFATGDQSQFKPEEALKNSKHSCP